MIYQDAMIIAEDMLARVSEGCAEGRAVIAGSLRRRKQTVHDIEFVLKAREGRPAPTFGQLVVHNTHLDKILYEMHDEGLIHKVKAGPKMRQYSVNVGHYGLTCLNPFHVEFYIMTPPAQWGVGLTIRTGPNSEDDKFSKWCVTNRSFGGALPDGYKVRHLGVWNCDQLDAKGEPMHGQTPMEMPEESNFLSFLGLDWIDPWERHAPRY